MINLGVIFGGESCEHDISIITGLQLISKVNEFLYNVIPIYITKSGEWVTGKNLKDIDNYPDNLGKTKIVGLIAKDNNLYCRYGNKLKKICELDVVFVCLHGINGEDGNVAGVLNMSGIPYSSCDILSSSVCMDKIVFNDICRGLDIPKVPYYSLLKNDYSENSNKILKDIKQMGLPVILKPSRQGSSIGIKICRYEKDLESLIVECFNYDDRIVVEKFINVKKEVNIACFYDKNEFIFSKTEEPIKANEFLDFNQKYTTSLSGMENMKRISPADIDDALELKIKTYAEFLYEQLDMFGIVRFDFMIDNDNNLFVNEVNTIPGSMANYLFGDNYPYTRLIEDMISNALIRCENKQKIKKEYVSGVLKQGFNGFKK